jgi:uncharacterized protein (DUF58 family)
MQLTKEEILNVGNLELLAKKAVEGFITGYHKSPFHGFSVEFAEHRQYNAGESTRNIDWRLYGRTDKLYVKQYEEETNLRCHFLIDTSSSMQVDTGSDLTKLQYAVWASAVFLEMLKKQRDASSLFFFDQELKEYTKTGSSSRHYRELMQKLQEYLTYSSSEKQTNIAEVLHTIANQIHKRSLIVIFSDFFEQNYQLDKLLDAIKHLKHHKHEVIVFNTVHRPSELAFEYGNQPVTFMDAESDEQIKVSPNEVREAYIKRINDYEQALKSSFTQYKIDYVEADTSKRIEHALIPFLVKRKKMV